MAVCNSAVIGAHFDFLCDYTPTGGIAAAWIGNFNDLDKINSVLNADRTQITTLALKSDKKVYRLSGQEESYQATATFVARDFDNATLQNLIYVPPTNSPEQLSGLKKLIQGAKAFVIYQSLDVGLDGSLEYRVIGYDSGLVITDQSYDTNASAGRVGFTLSNKANQEAKDPFHLYVTKDDQGDITTTAELAKLVATG